MSESVVDSDWHQYQWVVREEQSVLYVDGEQDSVVHPGCAGGTYFEFVRTLPIPQDLQRL